jgi:hemolysin D
MSGFGVFGRHLGAIGDAWADENRRRKTERRRRTETAFLPAALEILETPPNPLGRTVLWVIMALMTAAIVWAIFGQVDMVAVADGRVISRERLKAIEAAETGVVRAVHVREGDRVAAGDPLIELDPTYADADVETARTELETARLARARAMALLAYIDGAEAGFETPEGAAPAAAAAEARVVLARNQALEARAESLRSREASARAEAEIAAQEMLKLQEVLPLLERRLDARRQLAAQGLTPELQVVELEELRVAYVRDVEVRRAERDRALYDAEGVARELDQARQEFRATAAAELAEAEAIVAAREETVRKAETRAARQTLVSPVDGIIQEIAITTIGELAEAGAPLMTIVPLGDELIVEAMLLNRDVGFVRVGDPVVVKLEAYPFTRYGYLEGEVEHVSPDAIPDERRGLVFPVRVTIASSTLSIGDREPALIPGMAATAEVVTGRRTVMSYLLDPIARATAEAGRER